MKCPNCLKNSEIAYLAMSESLVCMAPGCSWERALSEDEIFELFFGHRNPCRQDDLAPLLHEGSALVHQHVL